MNALYNVKYLFFLIFLFFVQNSFANEDFQKFVSLKGNDANVRNGPGEEYKILFTYAKTNMPLEILHRIDNWYMIRDYKNQIGWLKINLVTSGRKSRKIIVKSDLINLCRFPVQNMKDCVSLAKITKDVVARIKSCNKTWCRIVLEKHNLSGWVNRGGIWGIGDDEIM